MTIKIAPSILSADFAQLGAEVQAVTRAGADMIHVDVMDGHFVPNLTIGPAVVKALRSHSTLPFDVHLMIDPVTDFIPQFAAAGADILTIHPESNPHIHRSLQQIKSLGKQAGIALNPGTNPEILRQAIDLVDLVLVMTVNPGFGGQAFIPSQVEKIKWVRQLINQSGRSVMLEVDGGINSTTATDVIAAGANVLVAGTAVFQGGADHYVSNINSLKVKG